MDKWYTVAKSEMGRHELRLSEPMTQEDAEEVGRLVCKESNLYYIGTYKQEETIEG